MNGGIAIFVLIVIFMVIVFSGWIIYLRTRNKERMALIERDKEISGLYTRKKMSFSFPWLKIGIITTGFSVGWLVGVLILELVLKQPEGNYRIGPEPFIMGIIFLFTSVSILIAYFADKPKKEE